MSPSGCFENQLKLQQDTTTKQAFILWTIHLSVHLIPKDFDIKVKVMNQKIFFLVINISIKKVKACKVSFVKGKINESQKAEKLFLKKSFQFRESHSPQQQKSKLKEIELQMNIMLLSKKAILLVPLKLQYSSTSQSSCEFSISIFNSDGNKKKNNFEH